jgi:hypothetical protein
MTPEQADKGKQPNHYSFQGSQMMVDDAPSATLDLEESSRMQGRKSKNRAGAENRKGVE